MAANVGAGNKTSLTAVVVPGITYSKHRVPSQYSTGPLCTTEEPSTLSGYCLDPAHRRYVTLGSAVVCEHKLWGQVRGFVPDQAWIPGSYHIWYSHRHHDEWRRAI